MNGSGPAAAVVTVCQSLQAPSAPTRYWCSVPGASPVSVAVKLVAVRPPTSVRASAVASTVRISPSRPSRTCAAPSAARERQVTLCSVAGSPAGVRTTRSGVSSGAGGSWSLSATSKMCMTPRSLPSGSTTASTVFDGSSALGAVARTTASTLSRVPFAALRPGTVSTGVFPKE